MADSLGRRFIHALLTFLRNGFHEGEGSGHAMQTIDTIRRVYQQEDGGRRHEH